MANYGFSFEPTSRNTIRGAQAPAQRPQDAVAFRSLTLPRQDVPGQIAAPSLTSAPGALGMPSGELLRMLIQMLGGQSPRSMAMAMPTGPQAPQTGQMMPQGLAPQAAPVLRAAPAPMAKLAPRVQFMRMNHEPITRPTIQVPPSLHARLGADTVPFVFPKPTPIRMDFGPSDGPTPTPAGEVLPDGFVGPRIDDGDGGIGFDLADFVRGQGVGV